MPEQARQLSELLNKQNEWKREVGTVFRNTRAAAGMTQSAFAASLDISQEYVSQIENGVRTPSSDVLRSLLDITKGARDGNEGEG
jgi:transcriptional regulator with XRE-family HTH domain